MAKSVTYNKRENEKETSRRAENKKRKKTENYLAKRIVLMI